MRRCGSTTTTATTGCARRRVHRSRLPEVVASSTNIVHDGRTDVCAPVRSTEGSRTDRKVPTVNFFRHSCCRVLGTFSPGTARRVESRSRVVIERRIDRYGKWSCRSLPALRELHRDNSKDHCLARNTLTLLVSSYISARHGRASRECTRERCSRGKLPLV